MPERLMVRQHPSGKYGLFDAATMQPVPPKFSFEKSLYDSQDEANAAAQQRMAAGYQMQPGLGGLAGMPFAGQNPPSDPDLPNTPQPMQQGMPALGPGPQMPGSRTSAGPGMTAPRLGGLNPMNGPNPRQMPNLGPDLSMMPGVM